MSYINRKIILLVWAVLIAHHCINAQTNGVKKSISGTIISTSGDRLSAISISYVVMTSHLNYVPVGVSDSMGSFIVRVPNDVDKLHFSSIGFNDTTIVLVNGKKIYQIILNPTQTKLDDVLISNGMFTRKKESFTGAVSTYTGEELKKIGNGNIIQSLKTLDPSFVVLNNNLTGSNPNAMASIEIRGKSSISLSNSNSLSNNFSRNPNMPLFILNGFETTLEQINDLDINRVKSVVLLKDAASTAIYGGRAANGVVVIETKPPKVGALRVTYNNDFRTELADLSSYNMMNAAENLEFQKLANFYGTGYNSGDRNYQNQFIYNERLKSVQEGVNTYWLNVPLRNIGITEGNSVGLNGGSQEFQFDIGLNYKNINGLMKGSNRRTWGGSANINYRTNKLNVFNSIYINGEISNESPYGDFSTYVNENPYFKKYGADGALNKDRYLEAFAGSQVDENGVIIKTDIQYIPNPIYNATLTYKNQTNSTVINDNFGAIWNISEDLAIRINGQLSKTSVEVNNFTSSLNTIFDNVEEHQKGSYSNQRVDQNSFQTNSSLTYSKVIKAVHSLTVNLRGEYIQNAATAYATSAIGFPQDANPNPYYAYQYSLNSKPSYSRNVTRNISALASLNYSYKLRYFMDATYRNDGASNFGSNKRFSPFYSVGLGWNINKEKWLQNISWISFLRLRANYGITGNQNIGSYSSNSMYYFLTNLNLFGQGYALQSVGLPDLAWQKTKDFSSGIDIGLLNDRLNTTVNYYNKFSDPLIININLPGSTGQTSSFYNAGNLRTQGFELTFRYSPIQNLQKNIVWTISLNGAKNFSRYGGGIQNILKYQNESASDSSTTKSAGGYLQRYYDGYSPDEIWAVKSLGIDPSTGQEVFLNKDGKQTYNYSVDDLKPLGTSQPIVQGVFGNSFSYKGFSINLFLRYSLGAQIFNSALYSKVENISYNDLQNNQDKRALELRWKQVGDIAQFKAINIYSSTPMSSRFIQKENYLSGESISLAYEIQYKQHPWIRKLGASSVRITGYLNDFFRLSNIQAERGINYPYSKIVSFSLNANF